MPCPKYKVGDSLPVNDTQAVVMASNQGMKRRYFEQFVGNLASCATHLTGFPDLGRAFVCPICLREPFPESSLTVPDTITVEHIIPRALGGGNQTTTLLCKDCNNTSGSLYDANVADKLRAEDIFQRRVAKPFPIQFTIDGHTVNASMTLPQTESGSHQIVFHEERSNPRAMDEVRLGFTPERWNAGNTRFTIDITSGYSQRRARIGLLRIGYLMLFRSLGYSYATWTNLQRVRDQLCNPTADIVPEGFTVPIPEPPSSNAVGIVTGPEGLRGFFAVVRLATAHSVQHRLIILPGMNDDGGGLFDRLAANRENSEKLSVQVQSLNLNPEELVDQDSALLPFRIWNQFCS